MNEDNEKVIYGLNQRLAIEREVRNLSAAPNAFELHKRAVALATHGEHALNALLRNLDTEEPKIRGGLGLLAQELDHHRVIPALQAAAADPNNSPAARLTAVMILERYLGVEVDPSLGQNLPDAAEVARQSALQALVLAEDNRLVLAEYAQQLLAEPPEIIYAVTNVIFSMTDPGVANLLAVIATYAPPTLAYRIVDALGARRDTESFIALNCLQHLFPEDLRSTAGRLSRKLRMAGFAPSPTRTHWRGLWSPITAQGQSMLWIICRQEGAVQADILTLFLHDRLGILDAEAQPQTDLSGIPFPASIGHVHRLRLPKSHLAIQLLELDPDLMFQLLQEVLQKRWDAGLPPPPALVAYSSWLWSHSVSPPAALSWPTPPAATGSEAKEEYEALLEHHAFRPWTFHSEELGQLLTGMDSDTVRFDGPAHEAVINLMLHPDNALQLSDRLQQQALWLTMANDLEAAALTLNAGQAFANTAAGHPFVRALAWRSLLIATADKASQQALNLIQSPPQTEPFAPPLDEDD